MRAGRPPFVLDLDDYTLVVETDLQPSWFAPS